MPTEAARYWQHGAVPGVDLLRARYVTHRYGRHAHETFTVGVIESGVEEFDYGGELLRAGPGAVALLNPEVVHTGQAGVPDGWSYRVLYPAVGLVSRHRRASSARRPGTPSFPADGDLRPAQRPAGCARRTWLPSTVTGWPPPPCCAPRWPGSSRAHARLAGAGANRPRTPRLVVRSAVRARAGRAGGPARRPAQPGRARGGRRDEPVRAAAGIPGRNRPAAARLPQPAPGPAGPAAAGRRAAARRRGRRGRLRRPAAPDPAFQAGRRRAARRLPARARRPARRQERTRTGGGPAPSVPRMAEQAGPPAPPPRRAAAAPAGQAGPGRDRPRACRRCLRPGVRRGRGQLRADAWPRRARSACSRSPAPRSSRWPAPSPPAAAWSPGRPARSCSAAGTRCTGCGWPACCGCAAGPAAGRARGHRRDHRGGARPAGRGRRPDRLPRHVRQPVPDLEPRHRCSARSAPGGSARRSHFGLDVVGPAAFLALIWPRLRAGRTERWRGAGRRRDRARPPRRSARRACR